MSINRSRRGGARSREAQVQAGTTGVLFPPPAEFGTLPGAPTASRVDCDAALKASEREGP